MKATTVPTHEYEISVVGVVYWRLFRPKTRSKRFYLLRLSVGNKRRNVLPRAAILTWLLALCTRSIFIVGYFRYFGRRWCGCKPGGYNKLHDRRKKETINPSLHKRKKCRISARWRFITLVYLSYASRSFTNLTSLLLRFIFARSERALQRKQKVENAWLIFSFTCWAKFLFWRLDVRNTTVFSFFCV